MRSYLRCDIRCSHSDDCYWKFVEFIRSDLSDVKRKTTHHILMRKLYPELVDLVENHLTCSRLEHLQLHELAARAYGGRWLIAYNYVCRALLVEGYTPDQGLISEGQQLSSLSGSPESRTESAIKRNKERFSSEAAREAQADVMRESNKVINSLSKTCEFCSREVSLGNYSLYHGEKCKKNPSSTPSHECPHCGRKSRSLPNLKRYHFDNCPSKPQEGI